MSDKKKERKKALLKKNRKTMELFNAFRIMREGSERTRDEEDARLTRKSSPEGEDKIWSEKVSLIRNRLNNQKRESKERWNRFAGTGDEGGRGL